MRDTKTDHGPELVAVLKVFQERCNTLIELAEEIRFLYQDFDEYNTKQAKKQFKEATLPISGKPETTVFRAG